MNRLDTMTLRVGECTFSDTGVKENKTEAIKLFRLAAEQGNPDAQAALGNCYLFGLGIKKNEEEGIKWLRKAAIQGQIDAQNVLKTMNL